MEQVYKIVRFDNTLNINETYSSVEYDRFPIDSILYRKGYNEVSDTEWRHVITNLFLFKHSKMVVHIDTV